MSDENEVDRHLANIRARFGSKLTEEQLAVVRERVAAAMQAGEQMRAITLDNGVEPITIFGPRRRDG